jgi:amino acid adenylation domain-containing protein
MARTNSGGAPTANVRVQPEPPPDFAPFEPSEIEWPIHRRFQGIATRHADSIAVGTPQGGTTYSQLRARAIQMARELAHLAPERARPVALFLPPGVALFAAMLGTLEAGHFYVPIDPALGEDHLRSLLDAADPEVLISDAAGLRSAGRRGGAPLRTISIEDVAEASFAPGPDAVPVEAAVCADDPAYVLFTSGSTGKPKGVVQSHRNVLHNVQKLTNGLRIAPSDRMTLLSSPSLGASVSDIYGALLNGAALHGFSVRDAGLLALIRFLQERRITIYHSVPSVFRQLARALNGREDLSALRLLKLGGEPVTSSDFDLYRRRFPRRCVFHVGLGSTEMNVIRQWFANHETDFPWPVAPLGYAVDDTDVVLVDEAGRPSGDEGEIAIVARTLPLGYWQGPGWNADAFPPASGREGHRMYRTGDLGRTLPDGCLLYLGRRDSVVKVRGQWVSLSRVEAALGAVPGIREAAVTAPSGDQGARLVAHIVVDPAPGPGDRKLREALREGLSDSMVPSAFVRLEALPRTPGGKVDRQALAPPGTGRPILETSYVPPRDEMEARLVALFAETLQLDRVGAEDDFFDLGGDSLSALEVLLGLEKALGEQISAAEFLAAPSPAALAIRWGRRGAAQAVAPHVVTLQDGRGGLPLFIVPGGAANAQELLVAARLARRIGVEMPVFGLPAGPAPHAPVEALARESLRRLRSIQPRGPYRLVGECAGGILAFSMACRLAEEGESVALALLDTPFPTPGRKRLHRIDWIRQPWGDNLARRLRHHRRAVAALPAGRARYLIGRIRSAGRALRSLFGSERRTIRRLRRSYLASLFAWRPERFDGSVWIVESDEGRARGDAAAWSKFASRIRVSSVPGDHNDYIREGVENVAASLRLWLLDSDADDPAAATPL